MPLDNKVNLYDPQTLNQHSLINITSSSISSVFEHKDYLFIDGGDNRKLNMCNRHNYSSIATAELNNAATSIESVDDNHIIVGDWCGYIYIFNIENNKLTQKNILQSFASYTF